MEQARAAAAQNNKPMPTPVNPPPSSRAHANPSHPAHRCRPSGPSSTHAYSSSAKGLSSAGMSAPSVCAAERSPCAMDDPTRPRPALKSSRPCRVWAVYGWGEGRCGRLYRAAMQQPQCARAAGRRRAKPCLCRRKQTHSHRRSTLHTHHVPAPAAGPAICPGAAGRQAQPGKPGVGAGG